jgi:hypothetical protein
MPAAVTSSTQVARASLSPAVQQSRPDNLLVRFFKEKTTDACKVGYMSYDWFSKFGGSSAPYSAVATISKTVKLAVSGFVEGPKKIQDAARGVFGFVDKPNKESAAKAGLDALNVVSPAYDATTLLNKKAFTLSDRTMTVFGGANFGALGIVMAKNTYDSANKMLDEKEKLDKAKTADQKALSTAKISNELIKLGKAVSYVALAVIGLLWTFGVVAMTPVVSILMLAAGTSALVLSISEFFHKNVVFTPDGQRLASKVATA